MEILLDIFIVFKVVATNIFSDARIMLRGIMVMCCKALLMVMSPRC